MWLKIVFLNITLFQILTNADNIKSDKNLISGPQPAGLIVIDNGTKLLRNDGSYPFIVQIIVNNKKYICAGTIIDKNYVLTTAKCVEKFKPNELTIIAGALNILEESNKITQKVQVKNIEIHDLADLAIIKLSESLKIKAQVNIIPIGNKKLRDKTFEKLITIFGFNMPNKYNIKNELMWADGNLMKPNECINNLPTDIINKSKKLCAICKNFDCAISKRDYGSPLVRFIDGKPKLLGIASYVHVNWETKESDPSLPIIYEDVTEYLEWIEKKIKKSIFG